MSERTGGGERPTLGETFLAIAWILATRSSCPDGARHGAVIVVDDRVVSTGYGSPPAGVPPCPRCWLREERERTGKKDWSVCPSTHAEMNAIACAARNGASVRGGTIWVTREPCGPCLGLLANAGILLARWPGDGALVSDLMSGIALFSKNLVSGTGGR